MDRALLDTVCSRVRSQLSDEVAEQAEAFMRQYYRWVPPEDLAERDPLDVYGMALAHFNLARRRTPGTSTVRVYNPEYDSHGWRSTHTAVEVVTDDMPFLTDSVTMELSRLGFGVHLLIHPVVQVRRDAEGRLVDVLPSESQDTEGAITESVIHAEIDRQTGPQELEELRAQLAAVLDQVRAAVEDWPKMRERALAIAAELDEDPPPLDAEEVGEASAFLTWLEDHAFTFLGYRDYRITEQDTDVVLEAEADTGLGILRQAGGEKSSHGFQRLPPGVRSLALEPYLLNLTKANSRATVHRPSYLDYVGVKTFDGEGRVTGRAPLSRPLHPHGLPRQPARHPDPAPQGGCRSAPRRLPGRQPQREGAGRDPRVLPTRRAVPDLRARADRDRPGDPAPRRAAAGAPVRPARPLRALSDLPRVRAARPLQHRQPAPHRVHPA